MTPSWEFYFFHLVGDFFKKVFSEGRFINKIAFMLISLITLS